MSFDGENKSQYISPVNIKKLGSQSVIEPRVREFKLMGFYRPDLVEMIRDTRRKSNSDSNIFDVKEKASSDVACAV